MHSVASVRLIEQDKGKMADVKDPKRARRFNKELIPPAVTTEYINAIGMMFSLAALLMKVNV